MLTSRGCGSGCSFCLVPQIAGDNFRARTSASVVNELEYIKNRYKVDFVTFNDEIFTYDKKRVLDICSGIKQRRIKVPWDCQTRVDLVSKELLQSMKEANCQLINFGVESANQNILNAIGKGTTVQQNAAAIRMAKEAGLSVTVSLVLGYPGESDQTINPYLSAASKNSSQGVTPPPQILTRLIFALRHRCIS